MRVAALNVDYFKATLFGPLFRCCLSILLWIIGFGCFCMKGSLRCPPLLLSLFRVRP
jgi:hypothetical protein